MADIKFKLVPTADGGYTGIISMPGGIATAAKGPTTGPDSVKKAKALGRAAGLADKVLDNPILRAALPPGVGPGLDIVRSLAKSKAAGKVLKGLTGPGAKRLWKVLG